ncbi:MAG TPA: ABC transporter ATP-binding protein, partial [Thermoanaerobaculia bacterium]|nr:ABC transporter ATP-binding protein [Thermoanaerobaculia bacterium]
TVFEPEILLCDEPFGALDPIVRREQQDLFLEAQSARRATMLFVTHDLAEALHIADRVVLIDRGSIVSDAAAARFTASEHPVVRAFVEAARLPMEGT